MRGEGSREWARPHRSKGQGIACTAAAPRRLRLRQPPWSATGGGIYPPRLDARGGGRAGASSPWRSGWNDPRHGSAHGTIARCGQSATRHSPSLPAGVDHQALSGLGRARIGTDPTHRDAEMPGRGASGVTQSPLQPSTVCQPADVDPGPRPFLQRLFSRPRRETGGRGDAWVPAWLGLWSADRLGRGRVGWATTANWLESRGGPRNRSRAARHAAAVVARLPGDRQRGATLPPE